MRIRAPLIVAVVAVLVVAVLGRTPDTGPRPETVRGHRITPRAKASMAFLFAGTARPAARSSAVARGWEAQSLWSDAVDWEPVVAADTRSDRVYQMAVRYHATDCEGCPDPVVVFRTSADGGVTWSADRYPFRHGATQADPRLAVAADGTLFAAFLEDYRPGVMVARSEDGGRTWSAAVPATGGHRPGWSDYPQLLVSGDGRDVYVALNAGDSFVAASHDGGRSFAQPVRTNQDGRYWFHTGGVVLADGTVLVAAVDYSQTYRGRADISVLRSTDGGGSWTARRVGRSEEAPACSDVPGCYVGFLGPAAALAADPAGTVMVVFNAGARPGGPQRLWYRTSTDGWSWSARRRVARGGPDVTHAFPLVVGGTRDGEFRVLWQDNRRGSWNTWFRRTTDAGASWARRVRLSTDGPPAAYQRGSGFDFPYGDYFGAAVDRHGRTHVIWGAGESWSGAGGAWFTRSAVR